MSTENLIYVVFLPFLLTLALLFVALEAVHIFQRKINIILSLIFTFLAMQTEQYWWFANLLPTYGSFVAIGSFVVVFFIGVVLWARGRIKNIYEETGGPEIKLERLRKKAAKLEQKIKDEENDAKKRQLLEELKKINDEIKIAEISKR